MPTKTQEESGIVLRQLTVKVARIPIMGTAPVIVHKWSEKAKKEMLDKFQGKAKPKKAPKDPVAEFEAARYRVDDKTDGFPAVGFKAAIIAGARNLDGLTMAGLKQSVHVIGEGSEQLIRLDAGVPEMREDAVKIGINQTDLRYRPQYWPWSALLVVRFIEQAINLESLMTLVQAGGMCGVGEWRPSAPKSLTGSYGTFEIDRTKKIEEQIA